jgi:hypothetical protein
MKTSAALRHACEYFSQIAPADAPPLPRSYEEREKLKAGGVPHIVAWFARSLEACNYDFGIHPIFEPYARGVGRPCAQRTFQIQKYVCVGSMSGLIFRIFGHLALRSFPAPIFREPRTNSFVNARQVHEAFGKPASSLRQTG